MDTKEIFDRQFERVYRVAMLYTKNAADAEDAAQSVFLKYIEKKIKFADENHEKACRKGICRSASVLNRALTNKEIANLGYISLTGYYLQICEN